MPQSAVVVQHHDSARFGAGPVGYLEFFCTVRRVHEFDVPSQDDIPIEVARQAARVMRGDACSVLVVGDSKDTIVFVAFTDDSGLRDAMAVDPLPGLAKARDAPPTARGEIAGITAVLVHADHTAMVGIFRPTRHAFTLLAFEPAAVAAAGVDADHTAMVGVFRPTPHALTLLALKPAAVSPGGRCRRICAETATSAFAESNRLPGISTSFRKT